MSVGPRRSASCLQAAKLKIENLKRRFSYTEVNRKRECLVNTAGMVRMFPRQVLQYDAHRSGQLLLLLLLFLFYNLYHVWNSNKYLLLRLWNLLHLSSWFLCASRH
uniref:Uncharacterized protein n=1 Tax=Glossina austeni TaxID=7395 RepID=A0A1A9VWR1_GLOAU